MPKYRLNRNLTLRSKYGRSVKFEKGVETYIPAFMVAEAVAIGAENCDKSEAVVTPKKATTLTFEQRRDAVYEVFAKLVETNDAKDFTASGQPNLKSMNKHLDFTLEKSELEDFWKAYKVGQLEE
jgi:hypothetical protein